ncbi:PTS sugar transporter subunit IIA [Caproiciproducens sp.]
MGDKKKKRRILIVSHGKIAEAMVHVATLIMGDMDAVDYLCLQEDESLESFTARIGEKTKEECEYIILADLMSGTPFNAAFAVKQGKPHLEIIAGFNLPLLLSLVNDQDAPLDQAIKNAVETGKTTLFHLAPENLSHRD